MKNYILKMALVAFAAFSLSACGDFLDRSPLDRNSDATNWTSEDAIRTFSWKFYGRLGEMSFGSGWTKGQYHSETLSDDYTPESFAVFTKQIPNASVAWNTPYDRIRETNIMLDRIDRVPGLSDAVANHWRGVARFFRALYHFDLLKTYGDVVWVDKEINYNREEESTRPRDSRIVVAENICADLQFAVDNCFEPAQAGDNVVNKYIAAALLSRVALYEGAWEKYHNVTGGKPAEFYSKAKAAADKVISSGLYEISDDYQKAYTSISLVGNKEVLFYKVYTLANANGGKVTIAHSQYGWVNSSSPTWGLSKSAVENYTMIDGRPLHMVTYNDKTMDGIFKDRDKRLAITVCPKVLPVVELALADVYGALSTTGYWTWKFLPFDRKKEMEGNSTWNGPYNDTDGPIFMYSEVLQNYAEACAELGTCTQADLDKSVNILRIKHGGIPALTVAGTNCSVGGVAITKDPKDPAPNILLQELRRDRRSELMADGFRHDDLMRWALGKNLDTDLNPDGIIGASMDAIKDYNSKLDKPADWGKVSDPVANPQYKGYKSQFDLSKNSRKWDDKYYLEPIPAGQILLDNKLTQNPGWE